MNRKEVQWTTNEKRTMNKEIDYERLPYKEPPDETDISLRAYLSRLTDKHLAEYDASWSDDHLRQWDGNFRIDGPLMLVCCERDIEVAEFRKALEEHIIMRKKLGRDGSEASL